jgi:hypothetical protein
MDAVEILRNLLDNPKLMEKHNYSREDIEEINLTADHENDFIRFMQSAVLIIDSEIDSTPRVIANRLIKSFK